MVSVRRSPFPLLLVYFITLFSVDYCSTSMCLAQAGTHSETDTTKPAKNDQYEIEPSSVVPGGHYTFVITAPASACKPIDVFKASDTGKPVPGAGSQAAPHNASNAPATPTPEPPAVSTSFFADIAARPSSGSDLQLETFTPFEKDPCKTSLGGTVSGDANSGDLLIYLQKTKGDTKSVTASLRLKVKAEKAASPIPPGLDPEVDLMWKVLPRRAVADSYGNRVADQYFAIETVIGNNSGWDLQVAALGFDMPYYDCLKPTDADKAIDAYNLARQRNPPPPYYVQSHYDPCARQDLKDNLDNQAVGKSSDTKLIGSVAPRRPVAIDMPTPIDAYPVVRSTIEREQHVGRRAVIVNLVKASGSTLVGIGGLLPDAGNFVKTTSIYNGPFEKGIELVYPDLTTLHLIGLDNRTLRDGTVIPNNTSVRVNVFISREIVMCAPPSHWWYFDLAPKKSFNCNDDDARIPYQHDFNPADVRERLGELTVVGRKIQYLERVRVLSKTSDLPESKPGILFAQRNITVSRDTTDQEFVIGGTNLGGTTLVSGSPKDLTITDQKVASDGNSISFKVSVDKLMPLAHIPITATSSRGFSIITADIKAHKPVLKTAVYEPSSKKVTVTGVYLNGTSVTLQGKENLPITDTDVQPDGTNMTFHTGADLDGKSTYKVIVRTEDDAANVDLTGVPKKAQP